jgi:uncharacterized membrane protein
VTFVAPWALALLVLLPIIVLLHLRRRREVTVGSLVVWRRVAAATPQQRLRWVRPTSVFALLLQLAAVILLVVALARPQPHAAGAPTDHVVIALDGSRWMRVVEDGSERFELARLAARDVVGALPSDTLVSILLVTERVDVVAARRPPRDALGVLADVSPIDTGSDWRSLSNVVAGLTLRDVQPVLRLWTTPETLDRAGAATGTADAVGFASIVEAVGHPAVVNAGLRSAELHPRGSVAGRWIVEGSLVSSGLSSEPVRVRAYFQPAGTEGFLAWGASEAVPDRLGDATFSLALDVPGPGLLELRLPGGDQYEADDWLALHLAEIPETRVLRVGPNVSVWDRALLAVPGIALYHTTEPPEDAATFDLVILEGRHALAAVETSTLRVAPIPSSGTPADTSALVPLSQGAPSRPTSWDHDHPLTRGPDWARIEFTDAAPVELLPGATMLVAVGDLAVLQARTTAVGREVVLAFDPATTTWPAQPGFPAFAAALVDWATPHRPLVGRPSCRPGAPCLLPREAFDPSWSITTPEGEVVARPRGYLAVEADRSPAGAPAAQDIVWPEGTFEAQFVPARAGRYVLRTTGGTSDVLVSAEPLGAAAEPNDLEGGRPTVSEPGDLTGAPRGLWRILAALAAAAVAIEAARAGLGSERWLRPRQWLPGDRRARLIAVAALSAATVGAAILAVAGAPWPAIRRHPVAVVVTDAGLDQEARRSVEAWLARASGGAVEVAVSTPFRESPATAVAAAGGLTSAVQLAGALLPPGVRSEIVVAAAGDATWPSRSTLELIDRLPMTSTIWHALPSALDGPAAGILAPPTVRAGEPLELAAVIRNDGGRELRAELRFGAEPATDLGPVMAGVTSHQLDVEAPHELGAAFAEVTLLDAADGTVLERAEAVVWVERATRALVTTLDLEAGELLAESLREDGLEVHVDLPRRFPGNLERLSQYDVVMLLDVPAASLHTVHQELLETWVRDRGGGLAILGGENAFGAGGYLLTTLDDLSPLAARVPDDAPEISMVFVLDRSGSMSAAVGHLNRLVIAQEATVSAMDLLNPDSLIGVVAFDAEAEVVAPMTPLRDRVILEDAIGRLRAGGGTDIYSGLVEAFALLKNVDSASKHVIVMTDGMTQPGDFPGILSEIRALGALTSFLGIGDAVDYGQLRSLADLGGGNLHVTRDFRALPSILATETMMAASDPIEHVDVAPTWATPKVPFARRLAEDPPPLTGYVRTTIKPAATLHLVDESLDAPLLASWRYGLGRIAAFASAPVGPWTTRWDAEGYDRLWASLARWVAGEPPRAGLSLRTWRDGGALAIDVTALDEAGDRLTGLDLIATVEAPDGRGDSVPLSERAAGSYRARIPLAGASEALRVKISPASDAPFFVRPIERLVAAGAHVMHSRTEPAGFDAVVSVRGPIAWPLTDLPPIAPWRGLSIGMRGDGVPWLAVALATFMTALALRLVPALGLPRLRCPAHRLRPASSAAVQREGEQHRRAAHRTR